jgi:hypothetical protein
VQTFSGPTEHMSQYDDSPKLLHCVIVFYSSLGLYVRKVYYLNQFGTHQNCIYKIILKNVINEVKRCIICRHILLSCVLILFFRKDVYFVDGMLVTCVPVGSVCGLHAVSLTD